MASVSADAVKCSRCNRSGHSATDCRLPFVRAFTIAEMRLKKAEEAAQRQADREAKQAEFEEKKARWEARQVQREATQAEFEKKKKAKSEEQQAAKLVQKLAKKGTRAEWDAKSDVSESTASTAATVTFSIEDVRGLAAKDKQVRKLEKVLRESAKLKECQHLDPLQKAKIARQPQVELERQTAQGLAEARARNELKQ